MSDNQPWIPLTDRKPTASDADWNGDVLFNRRQMMMLGRWDTKPVDATHWRHTDRYLADNPATACIDVSQETLTSHQLARLLLSMEDLAIEVYYPNSMSKLVVKSVEAIGEWVFINID